MTNIFDIIATIIITLFWIYIAYKAKKNSRDTRRELDEIAYEILKKHNEMYFHQVDRKCIIESMESMQDLQLTKTKKK